MDIRTMDSLSDWDDWDGDEASAWLEHPLHRPKSRKGRANYGSSKGERERSTPRTRALEG
jgi:hypothetical protein